MHAPSSFAKRNMHTPQLHTHPLTQQPLHSCWGINIWPPCPPCSDPSLPHPYLCNVPPNVIPCFPDFPSPFTQHPDNQHPPLSHLTAHCFYVCLLPRSTHHYFATLLSIAPRHLIGVGWGGHCQGVPFHCCVTFLFVKSFQLAHRPTL